ncbi:hypothetical protein J6590_071602 [Homalodisca vitripennis]|nr:hypothetical protein J6590_071602 [Homalodisca vitripennis]
MLMNSSAVKPAEPVCCQMSSRRVSNCWSMFPCNGALTGIAVCDGAFAETVVRDQVLCAAWEEWNRNLEQCILRCQYGRWHKAFKEGQKEVTDKPRSGCPKTAQLMKTSSPSYNPDLASCDFLLFPLLKRELKGKHWLSVENIQAHVYNVSEKHSSWGVLGCFTVMAESSPQCLVPVFACRGWKITTVEGIGSKTKGYNDVQARLAKGNGSQCGYCSVGMVMNMYSLMKTKPELTMKEIENSFGGNLCRCTGYRPILDSFKSFAKDAPKWLVDKCADIENQQLVFVGSLVMRESLRMKELMPWPIWHPTWQGLNHSIVFRGLNP